MSNPGEVLSLQETSQHPTQIYRMRLDLHCRHHGRHILVERANTTGRTGDRGGREDEWWTFSRTNCCTVPPSTQETGPSHQVQACQESRGPTIAWTGPALRSTFEPPSTTHGARHRSWQLPPGPWSTGWSAPTQRSPCTPSSQSGSRTCRERGVNNGYVQSQTPRPDTWDEHKCPSVTEEGQL